MLLAPLAALLFLQPAPVPATAAEQQSTSPATAPDLQPSPSDTGLLTFHITTREVILDLIALDLHSRPVLDLAPAELQITDTTPPEPGRKHHHGQAAPAQIAPITSLRVVDPNAAPSSATDTQAGFQIAASCLERSTLHYQLAFHPGSSGMISGYHEVAVTTTRRDVRLFYRHRYFVGVTTPPARPLDARPSSIRRLLERAACYYPATPPSISLRARLIDNGRSDLLRYSVAVDAASLSFLTLATDSSGRQPMSLDRSLQIDYAACNFDAAGHPINFFTVPLEQTLSSADYARALVHGFPHLFEFPAPPSLALTRFIVRDRATGNLGATDVAFPAPTQPVASAVVGNSNSLARETATDLGLYPRFLSGGYVTPPRGPIGSFGSIVPTADAFCGDVYELDRSSKQLPDFRELDPIGSLYASVLDVPSQDFTDTEGIPGVTPRTNLFGIDYHATFWIRNSGDYEFRMISDDGALLWVDDQRLIDLDGVHSARGAAGHIFLDQGPHRLHVPYYQGAVYSVALILWIKLPGQDQWRLFDTRDFPPPPGTGFQR